MGYGGNTSPGILYDGTGTGTFNPAYDYLTPGSAFEGFAITGSAAAAFSLVNNNDGGASITGGVLTSYNGVAYDGSTYDQRAVWTGTATSGGTNLFVITNDYYFNQAGQQLNITTTIEALADLTGLSFARFTDPDAVAASGDSSATNNFRGSGSVSANDLVYAEALVSKYVIGLYTSASFAHNSGVTGWTEDPADYLGGQDVGDGDNTIGLGFNLGDLLTGGKLAFKYQYIFGTDIAAAIGAAGGGGSSPPPPSNITSGGSFSVDQLLAGTVNPVFDGGVLTLGSSGDVDTNFSVNAAGGTVNTDGHDLTLSGELTGEGALRKSGEGVLTLTGANSQNGLEVEGGVVAFGSDGALGGGQVVLSGGALRPLGDMNVDRSLNLADGSQSGFDTNGHDVTMTGPVAGAGGLNKQGDGTLTLSGDNSFTGGLHIQGGSVIAGGPNALGAPGGQVVLSGGTSLAASGDMVLGQNLEFQGPGASLNTGSHDVVLVGALSGSDCLIKTGSGHLSLNAPGFNAIGACVREGAMSFNNVFVGDVWVDPIGRMAGSGLVNGDVSVSGTLAPGNSPGQLVVAGSVTQAAGSTLALDIDGATPGFGAGHHDTLVLTGAGSVYTAGGSVAPTLRGITGAATNAYTPQIGDAFQVVTAEGGVAGSFAAVTQPTAGLPANARFDVIYLPKAVVLAVTPASYAVVAGDAPANAQAVGAAVDKRRPGAAERVDAATGGGFIYGLAGLKEAQVRTVLHQAAGELHADSLDAALQGGRVVRAQLASRLQEGPSANHRLWGTAGADSWKVEADATASGYKTEGSSLMFGLDGLAGESLLIGGAVSYGESDLNANALGDGRITSYQAHGYAAWSQGPYYAQGVVTLGQDRYRLNRSLDLASGARAFKTKVSGGAAAADLELGRNLAFGPAELTLAAGLSADRIRRDGVQESGDAVGALSFGEETREALQGRIGGRIGAQTEAGGVMWRPSAALFVTQEFGDEAASLDARLSGMDFTVGAASPGSTAVRLATQLDAAVSDRARLSIGYRYGWAEQAQSHALQATASISW